MKKWEVVRIGMLAAIAVLLLIRGESQQQPKITLSFCDKERCYSQASACAANPNNKDDISVSLTCLDPNNCGNISYDNTTLFISHKVNKCGEEFEKCTSRCRL